MSNELRYAVKLNGAFISNLKHLTPADAEAEKQKLPSNLVESAVVVPVEQSGKEALFG